MAEEKEYNGWKNYQTWNVALWLQNEEPLYRAAVGFMKGKGGKSRNPYISFCRYEGLAGDRTPDNVAWTGTRLSYKELNAMMRELLE
jgi:hypothetical protein